MNIEELFKDAHQNCYLKTNGNFQERQMLFMIFS